MEVKEAILAVEVDSSPYSGHSFRSCTAITAARQSDDPKVRPVEEQRLPKMPRQILESINVNSK